MTCSALAAAAVAILVVIIVAIPLVVLSREIDDRIVEIIEGISKLVAALCILQLSLKMPKWLGLYKSTKAGKVQVGLDLTVKSIRFNVSWNIWREVAECGIFLLPSFLSGQDVGAIPLSAVVGMIIGIVIGYVIYFANQRMQNKFHLALFTTLLLVFLGTGMFVGGCHEFEEVLGETPDVWEVRNDFWSSSQLPMVLLKPFGYSSSRTVLQICSFWLWLALSAALHYWKITQTKKINADLVAGKLELEEFVKPGGDDEEKGKSQLSLSEEDAEEAAPETAPTQE